MGDQRPSGRKCFYYNCKLNPRVCSGLKLYGFPVKNKDVCEQWIRNVGNITLVHLNNEELKNKYICEVHFEDSAFVNPIAKNRLKKNAVPQNYKTLLKETDVEDNLKIATPEKTSQATSPVPFETIYLEDYPELETPSKYEAYFGSLEAIKDNKIAKLEKQLAKLRRILGNKRTMISKLKSKLINYKPKLKADYVLNNFNYCTRASKSIVRMQLMHKNKRTWNADEKQLSLLLFHSSPKAYRIMKKHIILPGLSTIRRWRKERNISHKCKN